MIDDIDGGILNPKVVLLNLIRNITNKVDSIIHVERLNEQKLN